MITIPLVGGAANAHQNFSMQLGDNLLDFKLDYVTTQGPAWSMNISRSGELLIAGAMLEPNAELNEGYPLNIGRFFFVGKDVTIDNLGLDNTLVWVPS